MLPESTVNLTNLEMVSQPSKTYSLNLENKRIGKEIDGPEALMQAVKKILNTERYAYVIYSSQYGVELERLLGQDYDFVVSDIERTIKEALLVDDRITSVHSFSFKKETQSSMSVSFSVDSNIGSITTTTEVLLV